MSRCRGCGAEVTWAVSEKGKKMIFDAEASDDGTFFLLRDPSGNHELLAFHTSKQEAVERAMGHLPGELDGEPLFVSHWATCPKAGSFR